MTSDRPACPYCNAPLAPLAAPPAADKLPCPRCGEPVPAARWPVDPTADRPLHAPVDLPGRKRGTALVIVGIMVLFAGVALGYALYTKDLRDSRHPQPKEVAPEVVARSPLELPGLGYLPPEYHVVTGLHLRELLQDPAGKRLFEEPRPAGLDAALGLLLRRTGLKLEQIDHVVAAAQLDRKATRATVVVRTVLPYNQPAVSKAVQPAKASLRQNEPLFQFALQPLGDGYLWCVDERTMILALVLDVPADPLHGIPAAPQPGRALPTPLLKQAAEQRLARQSRLWVVGDLEQAVVLGDFLALAGGVPKDWQPLKQVKAVALGLYPQDDVTLLGQLYTGDAKATAAVAKLLEGRRLPEAQSYKVETPPPGEEAAEAQWVTLQVRSDVEAIRELLDNAGGPKRR